MRDLLRVYSHKTSKKCLNRKIKKMFNLKNLCKIWTYATVMYFSCTILKCVLRIFGK